MRKADFMRLRRDLGGNYEDAKVVADFKERLTPDGFELYVKEFFSSERLGFSTRSNGGYNDRGVDVWGKKTLPDGTVHYVAVQCKKWRNQWIHKKDVSDFWGEVEGNREKFWKIDFFFITTTSVTQQARRFCERRGIHVSDEKILLEMHAILDLYRWMDELQERYCEYKFRSFVKEDYFEKKRMSQVGFDRQKLNFRLDAAVQTSLLRHEMDARFKHAWEDLFAEWVPETYVADGGELVVNSVAGGQVVYV